MEKLGTAMNRAGSYQVLRERAEHELQEQQMNSEHPIWDVWVQIKAAFPGPCANWEDEPPLIWAHAINGLTKDQVAAGIRNLTASSSGFPPSAGEFRELCADTGSWERRAQTPFHRPMLVDKTTRETKAREGLVAIKEIRAKHNL
mgnify:CR=1 FL=1|jgi:hypothetical protein